MRELRRPLQFCKATLRHSRAVAVAALGAALLLLAYCHYRVTSATSATVASISKDHPKYRLPGVVYTRDIYVSGYQHAHPELCPSQPRLMILVTSAPSHKMARNAIRLTWGLNAIRSEVGIAFVLGQPPQYLRSRIEAENMLYNDLIVGCFVDSYSNLTLKTLSMLEWMATYCPHVPYLLKTDDDMFVDVERLLDFTAVLEHIGATRSIWSKVNDKSKPERGLKAKYYVSSGQFPDEEFPHYATGTGYVMTSDCIRPLLEEAPHQPYVGLEDVFVTGILASRRDIRRMNVSQTFSIMIRDSLLRTSFEET